MNPSVKEIFKDSLLTTFNDYSDDVCNSEEREELGLDDYKWEGDELFLNVRGHDGNINTFSLKLSHIDIESEDTLTHKKNCELDDCPYLEQEEYDENNE
jgi:hypothetical protein|tara:strand:- start:352 stop:648 length:297 start_codon:yes stop_codon:yes gene_type:complete